MVLQMLNTPFTDDYNTTSIGGVSFFMRKMGLCDNREGSFCVVHYFFFLFQKKSEIRNSCPQRHQQQPTFLLHLSTRFYYNY